MNFTSHLRGTVVSAESVNMKIELKFEGNIHKITYEDQDLFYELKNILRPTQELVYELTITFEKGENYNDEFAN